MSFDVFLSHNSNDKPSVKALGTALKQRGLSVWLDEWELRPDTRGRMLWRTPARTCLLSSRPDFLRTLGYDVSETNFPTGS
jgi:hypothetical protein